MLNDDETEELGLKTSEIHLIDHKEKMKQTLDELHEQKMKIVELNEIITTKNHQEQKFFD